ncbi:helix-turn-helix domain-containing protein [Paracnuella aquatica]|uniref:helix-turn-helix domain-containing protein n=1 Tax=Paracnuella aquatica TaxID=2268757 RepID=UPI000DF010FB|nr:AraC family transcriptional regulator [Paracnuella aquatica]RPD50773.1 AraC family transcriptional regulator [Paracnuella aquatica]
MVLYVKNMVCNRCIKSVIGILAELGIGHEQVLLGEVPLQEPPDAEQLEQLRQRLHEEGFELIDDKKTRLIEQIKKLVLRRLAQDPDDIQDNLSDYLSKQLHHEYSYLSHLFSSVEGMTIEQYFIAQKIERAKELLVYGELSLSQIALQLGYSSVQHLSNQFKKVTGLTPTHFKTIGAARRRPLDEVNGTSK